MLKNIERVLWGVRKGAEDWQEKENGFDRFRVSTLNLAQKPDFTNGFKKRKG